MTAWSLMPPARPSFRRRASLGDPKVGRLLQSPALRGASLRAVRALAAVGDELRLPAGGRFVRSSPSARHAYVLLQGNVVEDGRCTNGLREPAAVIPDDLVTATEELTVLAAPVARLETLLDALPMLAPRTEPSFTRRRAEVPS